MTPTAGRGHGVRSGGSRQPDSLHVESSLSRPWVPASPLALVTCKSAELEGEWAASWVGENFPYWRLQPLVTREPDPLGLLSPWTSVWPWRSSLSPRIPERGPSQLASPAFWKFTRVLWGGECREACLPTLSVVMPLGAKISHSAPQKAPDLSRGAVVRKEEAFLEALEK